MPKYCKPNCTSRSANPSCKKTCQYYLKACEERDKISAARQQENLVNGFMCDSHSRDVKYRKNISDISRYRSY